MSLDVTLRAVSDKQIVCPCCGSLCGDDEVLFDANITHNLNKMAEEAGIYQHLWRPEELGITTAGELIEPLTKGLEDMRQRPEHFKKFDAENGWGTYDVFVPWIQDYLDACIQYPHAIIEISR